MSPTNIVGIPGGLKMRSTLGVQLWAGLLLAIESRAFGSVVSFECTMFPVQAGWTLLQNYCKTPEWLDEGWFVQQVELCPGDDPPGGQQADYTKSLDSFLGTQTFFVQWRLESTAAASELPWGGGSILSCWSFGGVNYIANIARDQVELWRDNTLPIVFLPIEPGVPHTYRLELIGTQSYAWLIDGDIVDFGVPEGPFPSSTPNMNFRTKAAWTGSTTRWAYIRFGDIPPAHSGDFDSSGIVDETDLYFFVDCLLGPDYDAAGPGCTWADMNADGVADGGDIGQFIAAMSL